MPQHSGVTQFPGPSTVSLTGYCGEQIQHQNDSRHIENVSGGRSETNTDSLHMANPPVDLKKEVSKKYVASCFRLVHSCNKLLL